MKKIKQKQVAEKILPAEKIGEDDTVGFSQLCESGGFELMQCLANCRQLSLISCQWSAKELKGNIGAQSKIYICPIQHNISSESIQPQDIVNVKQV